MHILPHLLALAACCSRPARGEPVDPSRRNSTGTLEVDVVFPQNQTYASSPHMPVVFALRNTGLARFLDSSYTVRLQRRSSNDRETYDDNNGDHNHTRRLSADELAWDDPHLAYEGFEALETDTSAQWTLTWSFTWTACLPGHVRANSSSSSSSTVVDSVAGGSVSFTVDSGLGRGLDIAKALAGVTGARSAGGVALHVAETLPAPDNTTFGWARCAVVSGATPVRDPQSITIDEAAAQSISADLEKRHCVAKFGDASVPECLEGTAPRGVAASTVLLAAGFGWLAYFVMFPAL